MKKKLLLFVFSLGAIASGAQTVTMTVGGTPVENGQTVTSNTCKIEDYGTGIYYFTFDPKVFITSSESATYSISVSNTTPADKINKEFQNEYEAEYGDSPYQMQFCWNTSCEYMDPGQSAIQTKNIVKNVPSDLIMHAYVNAVPYDGFTITCSINVSNESGEEVFAFNLDMVYDVEAGVAGVETDDNVTPEFYNLNGMKIGNPEKGIYIKKEGSKATKVVIR